MNLPENPLESFRKRNAHLYPDVVTLKKDTANAAPGITKKAGPAPVSLRIVICHQVMGGKNNICITRTGHRFPNKKWAAWRDEAVRGVLEQLPRGFKTISAPVNVRVTYVAGDRRRRDCPAILDAVWHVLEKSGVVSDDTLLWPVESSRTFDQDSPRCEIEFL
jgi:Holliday junction resolvase RusA-like endonuclease